MSPTNILDAIDAELAINDLAAEVNVLIPRTPSSAADVVLAGRPSLWKEGGGGSSLVKSLALRDEVVSVKPRGKGRRRKLNVRLRSEWLEALGVGLERGQTDAVCVADLAPGLKVVVDFCDPNATKAFHIGHLRNLALGNAIARLAGAAGAEATALSHVSDMGRTMGEALAGYITHHEGESPDSTGVKGDHLVGDSYSRYSATVREEFGEDEGPAFERELATDDLADELLQRLAVDDDATIDLWRRLRAWVAAGHEETLQRLGIRFDRLLFESDYTSRIDEFVDSALEAGVAEYGVDGSVGYTTGREEYPYILLQRGDGQWTQYLRCVAMWSATEPELRDAKSIQVMGNEWEAFEDYGPKILGEVDPSVVPHPRTFVVHGMVLAEGEKVSSSGDSPLLVDDLLDRIEGDPRLQRFGGMPAGEAAALIVLAFFLSHPLSKPMTALPSQLLDPHSNPGWTLAEGWAQACDPRYDGPPDPDLDDPDYRFLLLQAQLHRRFVGEALEALDVHPLLRFHTHLCGWFLNAPRTPRLARAMRTILREAFSTLGLMPARSVQRTIGHHV